MVCSLGWLKWYLLLSFVLLLLFSVFFFFTSFFSWWVILIWHRLVGDKLRSEPLMYDYSRYDDCSCGQIEVVMHAGAFIHVCGSIRNMRTTHRTAFLTYFSVCFCFSFGRIGNQFENCGAWTPIDRDAIINHSHSLFQRRGTEAKKNT